jgi:CDP-diacylglycerol---glycerol-3-phosphate 3-phosphatidyltransferase
VSAYRLHDLWRVSSLISLTRIPLAVAFVAIHDPVFDFAVLVASGLSDVIDGWYARRYHEASATGAAVDPITDKLFVIAVVVALVMRGELAPLSILLLATREIGELPLVIWLIASVRARRRQVDHPRANVPGKLATAMQFASITAALFHRPELPLLLWATAGAGIVAAASYWQRSLRREVPP